MLVCFLVFHRLMRKQLVLLMDVLSGFKSFSDAPHLARKCGTHRSDSPIRLCNPPYRGHGKPVKPGLLYHFLLIPCCDIVN
jgi:hypothetical protein